MTKTKFGEIVEEGIVRGRRYLVVKIETEGNPAPEIIVNPAENFASKLVYYNKAYNDDMQLINAKNVGRLIYITDVLMTSNLGDLNWFAY